MKHLVKHLEALGISMADSRAAADYAKTQTQDELHYAAGEHLALHAVSITNGSVFAETRRRGARCDEARGELVVAASLDHRERRVLPFGASRPLYGAVGVQATEGNSVRSWKPGHSDQRRRLTGAARQGKDTKSIKKSTRSKTIGATIKSVCLQQILATA